jgi:hypothetical protein
VLWNLFAHVNAKSSVLLGLFVKCFNMSNGGLQEHAVQSKKQALEIVAQRFQLPRYQESFPSRSTSGLSAC